MQYQIPELSGMQSSTQVGTANYTQRMNDLRARGQCRSILLFASWPDAQLLMTLRIAVHAA